VGEVSVTLTDARRRLATSHGREFWRSLDELAATPAFAALLANEFPRYAARLSDAELAAPGSPASGFERREVLKLMAASLALAGLGAGCTRQPAEKIVPYVRQPEHLVLGEPIDFATAMPLGGYAVGVLVKSHDGRPIKIEGNPEHPASLGATDALIQGSLLSLYDPDRAQVITSAGEIRTWTAFRAALREGLAVQHARGGTGLRILTQTVTSPTLTEVIESVLSELPRARWHQYEPAARDGVRAGSLIAFGTNVDTHYRFDSADVVVALDADIFGAGPARLRAVRDFTRRRREEMAAGRLPRLYVLESMPSVTGAVADHREPVRSGDIGAFAGALAVAVGAAPRDPRAALAPTATHLVDAIARDLLAHRGTSVVVAGDHQPGWVHAAAHAINDALGNVGRTVVHAEPAESRPVEQLASLRELVTDMDGGGVELLIILGGDPVYDAPVDLRFAERLQKVPLRVHSSLYHDETSELCHWHVPEAHYLESWGDARAFDGAATILQPLIAPLYGGRTAHEIMAACREGPERSSHDLVRDHWKARHRGTDFDAFWRTALHDGVVPGSAAARKPVRLAPAWRSAAVPDPNRGDAQGLEVVFRVDPHVHDGRFANNGWLQELPKPISKLTWDNAALLGPATAERLGLDNGDVVELRLENRGVRAPVWIVPGHANDSVTLHLGYGRRRAGRVGNGTGFDAYALRTTTTPAAGAGLEIRPTAERHQLATTQEHQLMEGRHLVRAGTLAEYRTHPDFARHQAHDPPDDLTLYPPHPYEGHAWGMVIDLSSCIGCNACTIACQAENNIPVVGKTEVLRGREMHWIRVDRYYAGDPERPEIHHQPVPCMHCENAPCEVVCPVNATVHSSEGLNEMVYNRCVGTRYCSNNCPYKVRRFNFFLYTNWHDETVKMAMNPDVTVRSRGTMEKCTYCVQRIERARIVAGRTGRSLRDGDVVPACQQVCPAEAIVFGDLNDPASRVAALKADPRNYGILADRNTRPRTTYLAAVRDPNPALGERRAAEPPGNDDVEPHGGRG
jgi:molybdopterin-containing oxidoreductase family iron-sulfur binding subunit